MCRVGDCFERHFCSPPCQLGIASLRQLNVSSADVVFPVLKFKPSITALQIGSIWPGNNHTIALNSKSSVENCFSFVFLDMSSKVSSYGSPINRWASSQHHAWVFSQPYAREERGMLTLFCAVLMMWFLQVGNRFLEDMRFILFFSGRDGDRIGRDRKWLICCNIFGRLRCMFSNL